MRTARLVGSIAFVVVMAGCGSRREPAATAEAPDTLPAAARELSPVDRPDEPEPTVFDYARGVGVAGRDASGRACIAIEDDSLATGTAVTIVTLDTPQTITQASVIGRRGRAWTIARQRVPGTAYLLDRAPGGAAEGLAIGIAGSFPDAAVAGDLARIDLDGDGEAETFRRCASSEGLHLTVWSGEPLKGPQDWHRYVYLGMDLEPDCTEMDTGEP